MILVDVNLLLYAVKMAIPIEAKLINLALAVKFLSLRVSISYIN